jgi:citrate lyase subunit beta/citryl-CoA lyase
MRSIFVFPATRAAFDEAMASEADGLAVDLAAADAAGLAEARRNAAALIAEAHGRQKTCMARIHALASGLADDDLDAVMAARPDGIVLPEACGGRDVQHLGAKLAVREAENGLLDGYAKILALAADSPAALFELGSFARATRRLIGLGRDEAALARSLGIAAPFGGEKPDPLRVARSLCLFAAAAAHAPAYDCAEPGEGKDFAHLCAMAARDGFAGKFVLTPAQAKAVNKAFAGKN